MFPFAHLFKKFHVFTYLWLHWVFTVMQRLSLVAVRRLLLLRSTGHRIQASVAADRGLWSLGSVVALHGLSCPTACEISTRDQTSVPWIGRQILNQWTSVVARIVKNLLALQETRVRFLGREDPLEKGMAPHSSILAWKIPWTEEPGGLQSMGSQRATERLTLSLFLNHWATREVPIMHLKPCKFKLD